MVSENGNGRDRWRWRAFDILIAVCLALIGYIGQEGIKQIESNAGAIKVNAQVMSAIKEWMAETKGNRFTSKDGLEVWKEIGTIRQDVARLAAVCDELNKDFHSTDHTHE